MIQCLNPDFRINLDPDWDVHRICPKMLWMHYLVSVFHQVWYNLPVDCMSNNPLFRNGEENEQELSYHKQITRHLRCAHNSPTAVTL